MTTFRTAAASSLAAAGLLFTLAAWSTPGAALIATNTLAISYPLAVGAFIAAAVLMVVVRRSWFKHQSQFWVICNEILTVKDPEKLSAIAAERKSKMMLLPYGIPIAIGSIAYFAAAGMLT